MWKIDSTVCICISDPPTRLELATYPQNGTRLKAAPARGQCGEHMPVCNSYRVLTGDRYRNEAQKQRTKNDRASHGQSSGKWCHHLTRSRPRTIRARENFGVHDRDGYLAGSEPVEIVEGIMSRPKAHYSMIIKNHESGARLKVELVDLPFSQCRQFRVRVNGQWARKLPVASKTIVAKQVRGWLVKH
jgi:hypothetical protein